MTYKYKKNKLIIDNQSIEFPDEISKLIDFDEIIVVLTDYYKSSTKENVYGIDTNAKIKWQIEKLDKLTYNGKEYIGITDPYVSIEKQTPKSLKLTSWDSTYFEIEALTGKLLTNPIDSRVGRRPW